MMSRSLKLVVLVAAVGLSGPGALPAWAEDDDAAVLATALKDTKFTLQDGLKASQREGQPISAPSEIADGELQRLIYTTQGEDCTESMADPASGASTES